MSKEKASQRIGTGMEQQGQQNKSQRKFIILIIVAVVAMAAVAGISMIAFVGNKVEPNVVVTPDNVQDIIAEAQKNEKERVPMGSYEVNMNYDWVFDNANATSSNAYVGNSVNNNRTVYFTVTLEGSEEVIYKSPYIPVGSYMKNITLNSDLEAGTHKAVVKYHLVDDAYKDLTSVSVAVTITIEH